MDFGGIYLMSSRTSVNKNTNQEQKNTKNSAPYIIIASLCIIVVFVVVIFALKFGDFNNLHLPTRQLKVRRQKPFPLLRNPVPRMEHVTLKSPAKERLNFLIPTKK